MYKLCQGIIKIIDDNFMKEDCFKKLDVESKIFYLMVLLMVFDFPCEAQLRLL